MYLICSKARIKRSKRSEDEEKETCEIKRTVRSTQCMEW